MTIITKDRKSHIQETEFDETRFRKFVDEIVEDTGMEFDEESIEKIKANVISDILGREKIEANRLFDLIIRESNDMITAQTPSFTYLSASALRRKLYKEASKSRGFDYKKKYGDYYSLVVQLVEQGIYTEELIQSYSEEELKRAGQYIDPSKDKKFDYAGLYLLKETYLSKGYNGEIIELPQERLLTQALYNMKDESKDKRMKHVEEAYWATSNRYIGLATPTLKNSGTPHGTLSSCHIVTLDDSLDSIMNGLDQVAKFSQNGAGIGVYLGFLRANGSWIRGYKGRATGITHPSRLLSVLAEYVNQLGKPFLCRV